MTVWSRHKRDSAKQTAEIIQWMQRHTIGDLKEIAMTTEQSGGDASSLRRLLTDLQSLQTERREASTEEYSMEQEFHILPR